MRHLSLVVFIILICAKLSSQELMYQRDVKLKSFLNKEKIQSFPLVNSENEEIGMFLLDKDEIRSYLFDFNYALKDSFTTNRTKGSVDILLGHTFENNNYSLIFTNKNKNKFSSTSIDVINKKTNSKEIDIKLKKEIFLESFSYNNRLYILTIKDKSSILKLYELKNREIVRESDIDFTDHKLSKNNKKLHYLLFNNTAAINEGIILNKIDNKNPNSIDLASYPNKIYCYNNTIYITIDLYKEYTKLISIDLTTFTPNIDDYSFPKVDCDNDLGISSNSYLLDNKIYQISGCANELYISISNFTNGTKIKEWNVSKNEDIDFKNTSLIQLGGTFNKNKKHKELTETQQFLRKIETGNVGISAYKTQDNLELTIGGYKKMATKEIAAAVASGVIFIGGVPYNSSIGSSNPYYYSNTTFYGFLNYSYARSVYFKSLLNENLENITESIQGNAFDKIRDFLIDKKNEISTETIFRVNGYYILGYYNKKEEKYYLLKFEN